MPVRTLALLAVLALPAGCMRPAEPRRGPPRIQAEGVVVQHPGGARLQAGRLDGTLAPDARAELREVEVTLGSTVVRAPRAAGVPEGPWELAGGVHVGLGAHAGPDDAGTMDAGPEEVPVEVEAPRMRLDARARWALLEGGVRLVRGGLVVQSPRVVLRYRAAGGIALAEAAGPVHVRWEGATLEAPGGARLDLERRTLELPGHVRLEREHAVLEGEGLLLDLAGGTVELRSVRGRLPARMPGP